jgi:transposase
LRAALTQLAHAMVVNAFHMLSRSEPYRELRAHDFDETRQRQQLVGRLARRIEHMGYHVRPEPLPTTRS